jgi:hypothetical protein
MPLSVRNLKAGKDNWGKQQSKNMHPETIWDRLQLQAKLLHNPPVVVAPGEALSDVLLGVEGLHQLDDLQVGHIQLIGVLGLVEVLLGLQDTLCIATKQQNAKVIASCCDAADNLQPINNHSLQPSLSTASVEGLLVHCPCWHPKLLLLQVHVPRTASWTTQ